MKIICLTGFLHRETKKKWGRIMRITLFLMIGFLLSASANSYSQNTRLNIKLKDGTVTELMKVVEDQSEFVFLYKNEDLDLKKKVTVELENATIQQVLDAGFAGQQVGWDVYDRQIVIHKADKLSLPGQAAQQRTVTGVVTDQSGQPLPGVTVVVTGTTTGTVTNNDGNFSLTLPDGAETLQFSFVGMKTQEIPIEGRTTFTVVMEEETIGIEEVVAVGYGTMKKSDLTGAVVRADIDALAESPGTSIIDGLRGNVAGLDVGQTVQAGEEPNMLIRGKSTLGGSNSPLVVVDGVIFRGSINDINPSDIESVDILKDASAAAVYGSQATNGVILLTTMKGVGTKGKPIISYSGYYSYNSPVRELSPPDVEGFYKQTEESIIFQSRTAESGYLEPNPNWQITNIFSVNEEGEAYRDGRTTNWYDVLTNNYMYTQDHNLSMANSTENTNYLISIGYNEQSGYLRNEGYDRLSSRINLTNNITGWLEIGVQSFMSLSDYSGATGNPNDRYIEPYATDKDANGVRYRTILAGQINPYLQFQRDDFNQRLNLFGNLYAKIDFPFVKGLSYKVNFANNYRRIRRYQYRSYAVDFQGEGEKEIIFNNDWSMDNILSFNRTFSNVHNLQVTLLYGAEKQQQDNTQAIGQSFVNGILGYNRLQVADSEKQQAISGAWEEASLYSMARIFYGYNDKYLLTGTVRRDGFSGFGKKNKFGIFPSLSIAWNVSEESFVSENVSWLDQLKLRASYGTVGNRTIGRYQTLATVGGSFGFIDMSRTPLYVQSITSLESPNLKWEQTTGINLGLDFGIFSQRVMGSIEYYNNNTTNLFYRVDIPAISRYTKFPDNLGKLHNHGLEISLTTMNIRKADFDWSSSFTFSRNRNELKELLGFDLDGDGKEDDLISEGLFIGKSIDAIYDYEIDGKWQLNDEIPPEQDVGAHKPVDQNGDGIIEPLKDKKIIGYTSPAYRFGMNNNFKYKNWTLKFFIYTIQGGKNHYLGPDNYFDFSFMNSEMHFRYIFPKDLDYWTPENPNGRYQRPNIYTASGTRGNLYGDRSFIRLENISLSYDLPPNLLKKTGLQKARIYLNGKNLLTLTKWNGWDPETNQTITRDGRPVMKSYTVGLNVEF